MTLLLLVFLAVLALQLWAAVDGWALKVVAALGSRRLGAPTFEDVLPNVVPYIRSVVHDGRVGFLDQLLDPAGFLVGSQTAIQRDRLVVTTAFGAHLFLGRGQDQHMVGPRDAAFWIDDVFAHIRTRGVGCRYVTMNRA